MNHRIFSPQRHAMAGVFVFLLLATFAVMSTVLVALSAGLYRGIVQESAAHIDRRVLYSYVWNTLHGSDRTGAISVREENGIHVLAIDWSEAEDAQGYETLIYCFGGELRELLEDKQDQFMPEYGETICAATDLRAAIQDQLLTLWVTDTAGQENPIYVALYSPWNEG